jgi:hypothetical protein
LAKSVETKEKKIVPCSENDENCHWIIDPPNGPVSVGHCKKCGSSKEFKNSFEYNTWHGERPAAKDKNGKDSKAESDKKSDKKK